MSIYFIIGGAVLVLSGIIIFIVRNQHRPLYRFSGMTVESNVKTKKNWNLFAKDSKYVHYFWYTFAGILFLTGSYFVVINSLFVTTPMVILGCLCYTIGKNHFDAQEFINLEDDSDLNEFWEINHSWKERGIYKLYSIAGLIWILFLIVKFIKITEVIR